MIINNPDVMLAQSPLSSLDLRSQSRFHVLYPLSSMFLSADIPCLDACIRAHGLSREGYYFYRYYYAPTALSTSVCENLDEELLEPCHIATTAH